MSLSSLSSLLAPSLVICISAIVRAAGFYFSKKIPFDANNCQLVLLTIGFFFKGDNE